MAAFATEDRGAGGYDEVEVPNEVDGGTEGGGTPSPLMGTTMGSMGRGRRGGGSE